MLEMCVGLDLCVRRLHAPPSFTVKTDNCLNPAERPHPPSPRVTAATDAVFIYTRRREDEKGGVAGEYTTSISTHFFPRSESRLSSRWFITPDVGKIEFPVYPVRPECVRFINFYRAPA